MKPMYYKTFYKMRRSKPQWQIDRTEQVCVGVLRNKTSEVMIFEEKVRLVSPMVRTSAEILVKDTEALALRRASVLEELHPGAAIG